MTDQDQLDALAAAATPGPWVVFDDKRPALAALVIWRAERL